MGPDYNQQLLDLKHGAPEPRRSIAIDSLVDGCPIAWTKWSLAFGREDARQLAALAVLEAAELYDGVRPARPLVTRVIGNRLWSHYRYETAMGRRPNTLISTSDAVPNMNGREMTISDLLVDQRERPASHRQYEREQVAAVMRRLKRILSAFELRCYLAHVQGSTYRQIATALGRSYKHVDCALTRARVKVQADTVFEQMRGPCPRTAERYINEL